MQVGDGTTERRQAVQKPRRSRADVSSDVTSSDVVGTRCRLTGERHDAPESPGRVVARPDEIRQNRHEKRLLEACKKNEKNFQKPREKSDADR